MREYPFFDVVGLDLVLIEDYPKHPTSLPFRLLEINAGSPSGASNNWQILQGLSQIDPEILASAGKVMPNDHFKVLGNTYRSLGESWTGRQDGVQIVLPPGGENGATPEIHQLAAYSGLVYADAGQLYRQPSGFIHLRTVSGKDPVVTAIYSRVNSDSAIFDMDRNLLMRDAESGKPMYLMDPLDGVGMKKGNRLRNEHGNLIPLESHYAIPGAIEAIHARKLYLGGLNRILDNKIILPTLCAYAPQFFKSQLQDLDLDVDTVMPLCPPETLPSTPDAVEIIAKAPEDWVIKSPNLSGGKGVYILRTLSPAKRRKILTMAKAGPKKFAYQKLVHIGRIPVAGRSGRIYQYANLAADLRMWAFFGAGASETLPRMTHNGLVRVAPQEKGPLSSTVNTSMGGGYAPLLVTDDVGSSWSVNIERLVEPHPHLPLPCDLPSLVGAQFVQVANLVNNLRDHLKGGETDAHKVYLLTKHLRKQCREILSFLHPLCMDPVNEMLAILEKKRVKKRVRKFFEERDRSRIHLVSLFRDAESTLSENVFQKLDDLRILDADSFFRQYTAEDQKHDWAILDGLPVGLDKTILRELRRLTSSVFPSKVLGGESGQVLLFKLELFCRLVRTQLAEMPSGTAFSDLFVNRSTATHNREFNALFTDTAGPKGLTATEEELRSGRMLFDSDFVSPELRAARKAWLQVKVEAEQEAPEAREGFYREARTAHFLRYPFLTEYQRLLDNPWPGGPERIMQFMDILPYAKYSLLQYAAQQGLATHALFTSRLMDRRIALLSPEERAGQHLSVAHFFGECFARKTEAHGLFSESEILLWIGKEIHPFVQAYTIGHELIHFQQLRAMMQQEQTALQDGPVSFAQFLNFYGNFLGLSSRTLESLSADSVLDRKPIYGFEGPAALPHAMGWVAELKHALHAGSRAWNDKVAEYGALLGYSTDVSVQVKIKAIREIIPAIENAKNIRFAKDLGLVLQQDEFGAALPCANKEQRSRCARGIERAIYSLDLDWEVLRLIGSHQYAGVRLGRQPRSEDNLNLRAPLLALTLGGSYNQTQQ